MTKLKILFINLLLFVTFLPTVQGQSKEKPNVIIIYADDLGYSDLSIYGGDIPTPHIDRIGKEGIRFTDFYVAGPVCTPSRFGLLTGSYPARSKHQLLKALMPFDKNVIDSTETTLAEYLKTKNYKTALIGKWHLGSESSAFPTLHGFDSFHGFTGGCVDYFQHNYGPIEEDWYVNGQLKKEEGYSTDLITNHAIDFLDQVNKNRNSFFLYLPYNAPHYGKTDPKNIPANTVSLGEDDYEGFTVANTLQAPESYYKKFAHIKDPYRQAYAAMVSSLDDNVGRLLEKLEKNGQLDNTIIWFISDNGGYSKSHYGHARNGDLRGQKGTLYEGGIRVPGLVLWKGKIKPNQVIRTPVGNVDIVPTLASILNYKLPAKGIDGKDISKVLFNNASLDRELYWKYNTQTALRKGDWKILNGTELYNLKTDRSESKNLAESNPTKLKELQEKVHEIEKSIGQVN